MNECFVGEFWLTRNAIPDQMSRIDGETAPGGA